MLMVENDVAIISVFQSGFVFFKPTCYLKWNKLCLVAIHVRQTVVSCQGFLSEVCLREMWTLFSLPFSTKMLVPYYQSPAHVSCDLRHELTWPQTESPSSRVLPLVLRKYFNIQNSASFLSWQRDSSPKNENSVINYSHSCRSKPIRI